MRDYALENVMRACKPPRIDLTKLTGSNFSQDNSDSIAPGPLPCTQKLVATLQSNDNIEGIDDSQMMTLN